MILRLLNALYTCLGSDSVLFVCHGALDDFTKEKTSAVVLFVNGRKLFEDVE